MPAIYPIRNIANGLLRGRNNGEVVDDDDQGKKCFWIGPNINRLFVATIILVSFLAARRLLASVDSIPEFYIFSHPLAAFLLKLGIPFSFVIHGAVLLSGVGLYLVSSFIFRDRIVAATAALFFFFLLPFGAGSPFGKRIFSGGGEVLLSLGFLLPSSYFYILFINRDGKSNFVAAAVLFALGGLSSGIGLFFALCFFVLLGISEIFLGGGRVKLGRIFLSLVCFSLLISFWYHPGFVFDRLRMWGELGVARNMIDVVPIAMVSLPVLATITFLLFDRREELQPIFVSLTNVILCLFFYIFGNTFDKPFVPNTYRFAFLAAVPFALLFGVIFSHGLRFFDLLREQVRVRLPVSLSSLFAGVVFLILVVLNVPGKWGPSEVSNPGGGSFWLSTGKAEFWFFAGVLISLLAVGGMVSMMRKSWPKDSYLDRVFSPRGAYEE